jgi:LPXTG-motif cell wall-anchored protein
VTVFEFDGPGNLANDLQSGESNIETLPPGTYGIGENLAALGTQWLLDDIVCTSADGTSTFDENVPAGGVVIDLAAGDTVSCTFFNEQQPGVVIPEAPFAILFPIIGLLVAAGGYLFWRRRQHIGQAG